MAKKHKKPKSLRKKNTDAQLERLFVQAQQFHQAGQYYEAERAYLDLLAANPAHLKCLLKLAQLAVDVGRFPLALKYARQAVELDHAEADGHLILGITLRELGLVDLAESELVIAQQLNPESALVFNNLGLLYMQQGRDQEANEAFHQAIRLEPENPSAYYNLVSNKKISPDDPDVALLESLHEYAKDFIGDERAVYHFAQAKVLHDCERFDDAFEEYRQANSIKRDTFEYDAQAQIELTDKIISVFDEKLAHRLTDAGCNDSSPVFIVGMPRSGTTLVESLLCRHPDVAGIGEVPYVENLANAIGSQVEGDAHFPASLSMLTPALCKRLGEEYVALSRQFGVKAARIVDKMPDNFLRLGFILSMLPKAKIIHCVRNPMDVSLSIYQQYFSQGMRFAYDLTEIAAYFLQYQRIMSHWHQLFPNKIHDVNYTEMVEGPDESLGKMLTFCGLEFDEIELLSQGESRSIRTASVWQARQPVYRTSVERWRKYEPHLEPLKTALAPVLVG